MIAIEDRSWEMTLTQNGDLAPASALARQTAITTSLRIHAAAKRNPCRDMKAGRRLQNRFACCGRGAGLEHEHAVDDTYSSRNDLPRANPMGVAAARDHDGVLRQPALEQRSDSRASGAKDQSRFHDSGYNVVPAAGVQRRMERLAPYRSRWRVHLLHDE